jgi:GntR family transcriptional regulator, arabinose operon transcriptional repressor
MLMYRLDKSENGTTLYIQLVNHFRKMIQNGTLAPGARLPTELELAQEHEISRNTVRQAMSSLVQEGLLERHKGRGTFVRDLLVQSGQPRIAEKRIGVMLCYAGEQLTMEILIGIEQAAKSHGYLVSFAYSEESAAQQARDIERLHNDNVAGLIIFPLSDEDDDPMIAQLQDRFYPRDYRRPPHNLGLRPLGGLPQSPPRPWAPL